MSDSQALPPSPSPPNAPSSVSFSNLFNHFFLLHDFFHKLTKTKAQNSQFFDLQIEIYNGMKAAVSTGCKASQLVTFGALCGYFMKGNSIKLRFLYGFLFMYWYNHIMTLGSYLGVLCRFPSTSSPMQISTPRQPDTTKITPSNATSSCSCKAS